MPSWQIHVAVVWASLLLGLIGLCWWKGVQERRGITRWLDVRGEIPLSMKARSGGFGTLVYDVTAKRADEKEVKYSVGIKRHRLLRSCDCVQMVDASEPMPKSLIDLPTLAPDWDPSRILIRPIRESDAAGLHVTLDAVCQEKRFLDTFEAPPLERLAGILAERVEKGDPYFVAEDKTAVAGWCEVLPGEASTAHIGRMSTGVLWEYRGEGIEERLVEATLEMCREIGLEKIEVSVFSTTDEAIELYRDFGFVKEGIKKRGKLVDGIYDDVVLMGLDLRDGRLGRQLP